MRPTRRDDAIPLIPPVFGEELRSEIRALDFVDFNERELATCLIKNGGAAARALSALRLPPLAIQVGTDKSLQLNWWDDRHLEELIAAEVLA